MSDTYSKTVEIEPVPPPDAFERVELGLAAAAQFAGDVGEDIADAISKLMAKLERRRAHWRRAA